MSKETIGKLIERCMYPKVLGMNVTTGQFAIRTPSGRKLGFSAIGKDMSPVATDTIKRAIVESDERNTVHIFRTLRNTARVFK